MISVIIPSYNSAHTISDCLNSLSNQSLATEFEIIVVDSSCDRTPDIIGSRYPAIQLIHRNKRIDPGTARNIGVRVATGELIAFIDADCIAAVDWLERIEQAHTSSYDVVGGIVRNSPASDNLVGRAGYLAEFRDFLPGMKRQEVMHIPTCNLSYKKRIFREYGLFQGEYYPQEDLIFNYDLWRHGEKILLNPAIQVWHQHRSGLAEFLHHQYRIGKATSQVLKKIPLKGSFIVRRPVLAACAAPLMTHIKFARTIHAFSRYEPTFIKERPMVLPVLALGLMCWAIGFVHSQGVEKEASLGKDR